MNNIREEIPQIKLKGPNPKRGPRGLRGMARSHGPSLQYRPSSAPTMSKYAHVRMTPASKDLFVTDKHATPLNRKEADTYRTQVGMLLYLHTCFDITKEVNWLAGFTQAPTTEHAQKLRKVAQYLKGRLTQRIALRFPRNCGIQLTAWADAAYRVHPESRSQYGCMVAIHPNAAPFWVKCGKLPGVPVS